MTLWDATSGWVTLVVRAPTQEEAREIASAFYDERKLRGSVDLDYNGPEWPTPLDPEGPAEVVIEDLG